MNKTESVARHWLEANGHRDIVYFPRTTPDFQTNRGYFEVKRLYGNAIIFTAGQQAKIREKKAKVLLFEDGASAPVAILKSRNILARKTGNFRVVIIAPSLELAPDVEKRLEDWRAHQRPIPSRKEAVNRLLKKALGEKSC